MEKQNLPPLLIETYLLPSGARFIVIRTRHGVYAKGRVPKGESGIKLYREAEKKLGELYSRTTIPTLATLQLYENNSENH